MWQHVREQYDVIALHQSESRTDDTPFFWPDLQNLETRSSLKV